jgi:hypothetical protein
MALPPDVLARARAEAEAAPPLSEGRIALLSVLFRTEPPAEARAS